MRGWIHPFLIACIVLLGIVVFTQERRISDLEDELGAAQSGIAAAPFVVPHDGDAASRLGESIQRQERAPALTLQFDGADQQTLRQQMVWQAQPQRSEPTIVVPPGAAAEIPQLKRRPSGEINGIPYYHLQLSQVAR